MTTQTNDPLHGITLQALLTELVEHYGWETLAAQININCFKKDPSIKSSLKFLRKTPWAREKTEQFYLQHKGIKPARTGRPAKPVKTEAATAKPATPRPAGFQADIWGKK